MKIQILFLAVLGLACGKSGPPVSVEQDLKEFLTIIPTNKLLEVVLDYIHYDQEVKEFIVYLQSEEFPKIHSFVEYLKEYTEVNVPCNKFFDENGFDVYEIVHHIHDVLRLSPYEPTNRTYMGLGFHGLYTDLMSVFPLKELKALYEEKKENREYLKTLDQYIQSPTFQSVLEEVKNRPEYSKLIEILREKFVNLKHIHELVVELYQRGFSTFVDELKEFMPLDPTAKVFDIVLDYLTNDPELNEFIVYIQSEEFPKIHKFVEYLKKYKEMYLPCLKYIDQYGVDVNATVHDMYPFISNIYVILGLPPLEPTYTTRKGVGLPGLIENIISVLPLDDWKVLLEQKVETMPSYKIRYEAIHSPEFMKMVKTVQDLPEYVEMVEMLRKINVDEERIIELIRTLYNLPQL